MILTEITRSVTARLAEDQRHVSLADMKAAALARPAPEEFPFERALAGRSMSFICEVKKASPSKGVIVTDFPYVDIAREYEAAGAAAISCLTERDYFQGHVRYLKDISRAVTVPVLRKDFIVSPYQIYEARACGAAAILLIEVDGHPAQVADEAVVVERVLQQTGAVAVHVAKDAAEKFKLWEARRQALPVLARCKPTTVLEDATVPRSQIPAMMKAVNDIAKKYNVEVGTFGHAGDGNLHPTFLCDKRDKDEFERVERAVDELFNTTIEMGGTLSGEHGIGTAKQKWLEKETSRGTIGYSRRLRKAIDPKGLFNPSKLVGV